MISTGMWCCCLLKVVQGMPLWQVAGVVGVSLSTVNYRLNQGLSIMEPQAPTRQTRFPALNRGLANWRKSLRNKSLETKGIEHPLILFQKRGFRRTGRKTARRTAHRKAKNTSLDPDLALIQDRWPTLPEHIKQAVLTLVRGV